MWDGQLGSGGWRRCAKIRDEIGNGEVRLVAYRRDDRDCRFINCTRDCLFIKCPQFLKRTATTTYYQYICFTHSI
ncbi:hypothetical protein D3C79_1016810 [compost metagenome]